MRDLFFFCSLLIITCRGSPFTRAHWSFKTLNDLVSTYSKTEASSVVPFSRFIFRSNLLIFFINKFLYIDSWNMGQTCPRVAVWMAIVCLSVAENGVEGLSHTCALTAFLSVDSSRISHTLMHHPNKESQ